MAEGKFFIRQGNGLSSVFRYKLIKTREPNADPTYPEHPLFITLTSERVTFSYHGKVKGNGRDSLAIYELFHLDLNRFRDLNNQSTWVTEDLCYESVNLHSTYKYEPVQALSYYAIEDKKIIQFNSKKGLFNISNFSGSPLPLKQYHLFLDFLQDFFHSRVFQDIPHYQKVRRILLQNQVISGIYAKCNFYYWVIQHHQLVKKNQGIENYENSAIYKDCMLKLAEAENFWIEKILDPHNISLFASRTPWFHDSEKEMELATTQNVKGPTGKEWKDYIHDFANKKDKEKDVFSRFVRQDQQLSRDIATYWVKRYYIYNTLAFSFKLKHLFPSKITAYALRTISTIIFFLIPIILFFISIACTKFSASVQSLLCYGSHFMISLGLLGALFILAPIGFFTAGLFLAYAPQRVFRFKLLAFVRDLRPALISASLPRMQLGVISGWLIFATSDDLWKINYDIGAKPVFWFALLTFLLSIYFVSNEVLREAPDIRYRNIINRSFIILIIGFSVSCFMGLMLMNFEGKKMIQRIPEIKQKYYLAEIDWLKHKELEMRGRLSSFSRLNDIVVGYHNYHESEQIDGQYLKHIASLILEVNDISFLSDTAQRDLNLIIEDAKSNDPNDARNTEQLNRIFNIQRGLLAEIKVLNDSITAISDGLIQLQSQVEDEEKCFKHFIENSSTQLGIFSKENETVQKKQKNIFPMNPEATASNADTMLNHLIQLQPKPSAKSSTYYVFEFSPWFLKGKYHIYPLLLYFNSVLALFVGLFVQLLLQKTNITDPI